MVCAAKELDLACWMLLRGYALKDSSSVDVVPNGFAAVEFHRHGAVLF